MSRNFALVVRFVKRAPIFYAFLLAAQLILGFALSQADYEFAQIGRLEAGTFESMYVGASNPQPFLFSAEWGLRYYLTSMAGEIIAQDTTGSPGELFLKSPLALGQTFDNELGRSLELIDQHTYRTVSPVRLLDPHTHAGFWSDGWGVLPFWFSRQPMDELSIYRVKQISRGRG